MTTFVPDTDWLSSNLDRLNSGFTAVLGTRPDNRPLTHKFGSSTAERILWIDGEDSFVRTAATKMVWFQMLHYSKLDVTWISGPSDTSEALCDPFELAVRRATANVSVDSAVVLDNYSPRVQTSSSSKAVRELADAVRSVPGSVLVISGNPMLMPYGLESSKFVGGGALAYFGLADGDALSARMRDYGNVYSDMCEYWRSARPSGVGYLTSTGRLVTGTALPDELRTGSNG